MGGEEVDSTQELSAIRVRSLRSTFLFSSLFSKMLSINLPPRFASGDTEARENKGKKHAVIDFMLHLYFKGMRMSIQLHCASLHGLVSCVSFQPRMTHAIGTLYNVVVFIRVSGWGLLQRTMVNLFAFSPSPTEAFY